MTAIAASFGPSSQPHEERTASLLSAMRGRGDRPTIRSVVPAGAGAMGASPFDWQAPWAGSGTGECGPVVAVADATLYYIDDLLAALRDADVSPTSTASADLIAAAILAWNDDALERLEGDFAFVAMNQETGEIFAARDWGGLRSLYVGSVDGGVAIAFATEAAPLASLPGVDATLNLAWIAEAAAGRYESPRETAYMGVEVVPAGALMRASLEGGARVRDLRFARRFDPPVFLGDERPPVSFDEAKLELRALMEAAVRERIPSLGEVAVALSGGRDSTAVYALARRVAGDRVRSMSVSYPEGDPGREDDVVRDVLSMCGGEPHWIEATDLPILETIQASAAQRHEPFGHVYAEFQEALARAARHLHSRVLLNGSGGDQLFSGEPTYLADLLRSGKIRTLWKEWRKLELGRDWKALFRLIIWPNLGPASNRILTLIRGGAYPDPFDRPLPSWIRQDFVRQGQLDDRHLSNFPSRSAAASAADFERRWLLTHPFFPRVFAEAYRLYLKEGVELRTPLADARLLRFAATRPRWERRDGWQVKMLMRASLTDVLPPSVTKNRRRPTGTTEGLLSRALRANLSPLVEEVSKGSELEALGILDPSALRGAAERVARGEDAPDALDAVYTILAEMWLRSRPGNAFRVASSRGRTEIAR